MSVTGQNKYGQIRTKLGQIGGVFDHTISLFDPF